MLVKFFFLLRKTGVPVSITELLTLLEALKAGSRRLDAPSGFTIWPEPAW